MVKNNFSLKCILCFFGFIFFQNNEQLFCQQFTNNLVATFVDTVGLKNGDKSVLKFLGCGKGFNEKYQNFKLESSVEIEYVQQGDSIFLLNEVPVTNVFSYCLKKNKLIENNKIYQAIYILKDSIHYISLTDSCAKMVDLTVKLYNIRNKEPDLKLKSKTEILEEAIEQIGNLCNEGLASACYSNFFIIQFYQDFIINFKKSEMEKWIDKAIALGDIARGYFFKGYYYYILKDFVKADTYTSKSLSLGYSNALELLFMIKTQLKK